MCAEDNRLDSLCPATRRLVVWLLVGSSCEVCRRRLMLRGVCFTYGTMFALESLSIAGESYANSERVRRACDFLVDKQKPDGGWGETYMVCWSSGTLRQCSRAVVRYDGIRST
jgi:lanosterol synthase